jgi:Microtubule binding
MTPYPQQFDRVFGTGVDQAEVYEEVSPLITSCLDGYSVCIFAYGQVRGSCYNSMQLRS